MPVIIRFAFGSGGAGTNVPVLKLLTGVVGDRGTLVEAGIVGLPMPAKEFITKAQRHRGTRAQRNKNLCFILIIKPTNPTVRYFPVFGFF